MRRSSTIKQFFIGISISALLMLNVFHSYSQCVPITVVANCQTGVTENFDNDANIGSSGFSGDFTLQGSSDKFLESTGFPNNTTAVKTLVSNTYIAPAVNGTINVRFDLAGTTTNASTLEIFARTSSGDIPLCTSGSANVSGLNCFTFLTSVNLAGQLFRFVFRFTFSGNNTEIRFDDFGTNVDVSGVPLPVSFISFEAQRLSNGTQLTWQVAIEQNVKVYEIEKSIDGRNYTTIGFVSASGQSTYSFKDVQLSDRIAFYRIKSVDNDGAFKYSNILSVKNGAAAILLHAFPMPAKTSLTVQHAIAGKGAKLNISSSDGRTVRIIVPAVGNLETIINVNGLMKGVYILRFNNGNGQLQTLKFLKE